MALFEVPKRANKMQDKKIAEKVKTAKKINTVRGGNDIIGRISEIKAMVEKNLGQFKDDYIIIRDTETLHTYMEWCLDNKVISIDTETTGLNPLVDKIVGLCIYTPEQKAAYVPINHMSYITGVKSDNQLSEKEVANELSWLFEKKPDVIMFNANFDIRVIKNQLKVSNVYCTWDAYLAA